MIRRFKLKINGESPRSLFLTFVLSKLNCDVYVYNFLSNTGSKEDYQIFSFFNSTKDLLSKFDIWNEIEDISYNFTSLIIKDNLVYEELLLRPENLSIKFLSTIGWSVRYSDLKSLLINKLINSDNVHFVSNNQLIDESFIFDYEFNFKNEDKISNLFNLPLSTSKRLDQKILTFNVYLRGHIEKRLYEINTTKGLLILTPLNKNLYQITWNNPSSQIKEISLLSNSFFLDILTTLLPNELKVDQIVGDINSQYFSNIQPTYLIKNKSIIFNENKLKSNIIYNFNFEIIIIQIFKIYYFLENNQSMKIKFLNRFGFYYLLRTYLNIIINLSFSKYLFNLFIVNNIMTLFLRKLLFVLIRRINLIKIFLIRNFMNSKVYNRIK